MSEVRTGGAGRRGRIGADNPRVQKMVGWQRHLMKLRLMHKALAGVRTFRRQGDYAGVFPFTVQVQTRTECNNRCTICPHPTVRDRVAQGEMDPALFYKLADECLEHPELISLGPTLQNEPLLDPRLCDFLRHFSSRRSGDTLLFISSNGLELTPEVFSRLESAGLDFIQISVNADCRQEYERICPGRDWDKLQQNLAHLLERDLSRVGLQLSFVRTRDNNDELRRALDAWQRRGVPTLVHRLSNRGGALDAYDEHYLEPAALSLSKRLFRRLVRRVLPVCPYPFFQASVLFNGDQLICTHDWNRQTVLGNVRQQSLAEVWNGPEANRVRQLWFDGRWRELPSCRDCSVYRELSFA